MKLAVIGSRDFLDYELLKKELDRFRQHTNIDVIVSGGARGADTLAKRYADENGITPQIILADWNLHGSDAGFLRNTDIVKECDAVMAFWNGKSGGTLDSMKKAKQAKKQVIQILYAQKSSHHRVSFFCM